MPGHSRPAPQSCTPEKLECQASHAQQKRIPFFVTSMISPGIRIPSDPLFACSDSSVAAEGLSATSHDCHAQQLVSLRGNEMARFTMPDQPHHMVHNGALPRALMKLIECFLPCREYCTKCYGYHFEKHMWPPVRPPEAASIKKVAIDACVLRSQDL